MAFKELALRHDIKSQYCGLGPHVYSFISIRLPSTPRHQDLITGLLLESPSTFERQIVLRYHNPGGGHSNFQLFATLSLPSQARFSRSTPVSLLCPVLFSLTYPTPQLGVLATPMNISGTLRNPHLFALLVLLCTISTVTAGESALVGANATNCTAYVDAYVKGSSEYKCEFGGGRKSVTQALFTQKWGACSRATFKIANPIPPHSCRLPLR